MGYFNKFFNKNLVEGTRVLRHSKISSLATDFTNNGEPFTIFIAPLNGEYDAFVLLDIALLLEDDSVTSPLPFNTMQWSECVIRRIKANATILTSYDIYIGGGR